MRGQRAHSHDYHDETCTCKPGAKEFESYHIHVVFYPDVEGEMFADNTHSSQYARALYKKFVDHFDVPQCPTEAVWD